MKSIIIGAIFLLLVDGLAYPHDASTDSSIEPELRAAMTARTKAHIDGDTEKVESLMLDDYIQTDVSGRVQNKSEWLADYFKPLSELIKARKFRWDKWEESDIQTRSYGNISIVMGRLALEGSGANWLPGRGLVVSPESHLGPVVLCFTRIWIKKGDKWLLAAVHNAMLPPQTTN